MSELTFEEPPPAKRAHRNLGKVADELREHPGLWAVVLALPVAERSHATSLARQIRHGLVSYWRPAGVFEAVSRTVDGEARVYARYLGGEEVE